MGVDHRRGHLQPAANRGAHRIVDLVQQPGNRHEAVADRLDLLESMLGGDPLENDEQRIEPRDHVLGLVLVAIGREVGHVAEQDRDVLVAPRDDGADAPDLVGGLFRQQRVQQQVGLLARLLGFDQRFLQGELGPHPGQHDRSRERLVDVVDGADVEAFLLVDLLGLGGEEDDGNVARGGNVLESPADFIAVHAGHHHVEQDEIRLLGARWRWPAPSRRWWQLSSGTNPSAPPRRRRRWSACRRRSRRASCRWLDITCPRG